MIEKVEQRHFKPTETLNIVQYTEEVYFTLFPNKTHSEYLSELDVDEKELVKKIEQSQGTKIKKIRRVIVDEQYLYWVGKNKKKKNKNSLEMYMEELTDEEVVQLWENEFGTHMLESHFIPVTLIAKDDFYLKSIIKIPDQVLSPFKGALVEHWKENKIDDRDIMIIPEMLDVPLYSVEEERMILEAFQYFFAEQPFPKETNVKTGPKKPANLGMRYIPVFFKRENKAVLTPDELESEYINPLLPTEASETFSKEMTKQSEEKDYTFTCNSILMPAYQYEEYYNDFTEAVESELRRIKEK